MNILLKRTTSFSLFVLLILGLSRNKGYTQISSPDSLMIVSEKLIDVLELIEKKHQLRFKYKQEWVADVTINQTIKYSSLEQLLDKLLATNNLTYLLRDPNYVILLKNNPIKIDFDDKGGQIKPQILALGTISMGQTEAILSGKIISGDDLHPIPAATVKVDNKFTVVTDESGYYQIKLPVGIHELKINSLETKAISLEVNLFSSAELNLSLYKDFELLDDVIVTAKRLDENVKETIAGRENFTLKEMDKLPAFLGETDVVRSIASLPGVNVAGEAASGFSVRGSSAANNLVLADNAMIFNTSHMLGLFTAFNPNTLKSVEFYKGTMPAKYGGRLSSVLDIEFREADKMKFSTNGSVGVLSSSLNFDIPIIKEKSSLLIGARTAYPNYLRTFVTVAQLRKSAASFSDLNLKYHHTIDEKNVLSVSAYASADDFKLAKELNYKYDQLLLNTTWSHVYNDNLSSKITYGYSKYRSNLEVYDITEQIDNSLSTDIAVNQAKLHFNWDGTTDHQISYGFENSFYTLNPRDFYLAKRDTVKLPEESGVESAVYIEDVYNLADKFSIYGGLRFNVFYGGVKPLQTTYFGVDPRFSINFTVDSKSSLRLGYTRSRQFLQLISNTTSISPVDMRKLANTQISPTISDQISLGYFRNFNENNIETSAEVYYTWLTDAIDYKNGADLYNSVQIESELLRGEGRNYGLEFYLKKNRGRVTGWLSYAYNRSLLRFTGESFETEVNNGEYYASNYDQPHNLNVFANLKYNRRFDFSLNFVYNTGRPMSLPTSVYEVYGETVAEFSTRNNYRIPEYHRLDFSMKISPNLRRDIKYKSSLTITLYNIYSRRNAYSIFFRPSLIEDQLSGYKLSIIGNIVPSLTYNFKF